MKIWLLSLLLIAASTGIEDAYASADTYDDYEPEENFNENPTNLNKHNIISPDKRATFTPEEKTADSALRKELARLLIDAAKRADLEGLKEALSRSTIALHIFVNMSKNEEGITALMAATSNPDYTDYSPDFDESDEDIDLGPVDENAITIFKILIKLGANLKAKDHNEETAMMHAVRNADNWKLYTLCFEPLPDQPEDAKVKSDDERRGLHLRNKIGRTALMIAIEEGNKTAVKLLLEAGAYNNHTLKDNDGNTAHDIACEAYNDALPFPPRADLDSDSPYYDAEVEELKDRDEIWALIDAADKSKGHDGARGRGRGRGRGKDRGRSDAVKKSAAKKGRGGYRGRGRGRGRGKGHGGSGYGVGAA